MNRIILVLLAAAVILTGCEKKKSTTDFSDSVSTAETNSKELIEVTCLHPSGYRIRETPNAESFPFSVKYMAELTWTGNAETVGNFEWWEVINEDGSQKGWVHELFFAKPGTIAVMTDDNILYDEPKLTAVNAEGTKVLKYQVISIREIDNNYLYIKWTEKNGNWGQGYIKDENISKGAKAELDMEVIEALEKLNAPNLNADAKEELLKNLLQLRSSSFYPDVLDFRDRWENRDIEDDTVEIEFEMPEDPMAFRKGSLLKINREGVNMRNQPSLSDTQVIATLPNQTEVLVIEAGTEVVEVEGFGSNLWYKVSAEAQGDEEEELSGWIFGAFLSE